MKEITKLIGIVTIIEKYSSFKATMKNTTKRILGICGMILTLIVGYFHLSYIGVIEKLNIPLRIIINSLLI